VSKSVSEEQKLTTLAAPVKLRELLRIALVDWLRFIFVPAAARQRRTNRLAFRAAIKGVRRELRHRGGQALRRRLQHEPVLAHLDPNEIHSVLICRINGRLGNTLLLTPLIKQIREWLPNAAIDLALAYPRAEELLRDVPSVRRIIAFPYKLPQVLWRYLPSVVRLRARSYDLAIDPVADSTSGRMAMTFCRARYRLGFETESQWAPLTHRVPVPTKPMHDAARPVYLLGEALGITGSLASTRLWLPLLDRELVAGREQVSQALRSMNYPDATAATFGFFAHAAGSKVIERDWWLGFWHAFLELEPDAVPVEFLPLAGSKPIDSRYPVLHARSPRDMVAAIAATRMFISPDTGPMHLASATEVPTVALFGNSDAARYHPMKTNDICIDVTRCMPRVAAELCQRRWRERTLEYAQSSVRD
jgi:heptosyltransferase-3